MGYGLAFLIAQDRAGVTDKDSHMEILSLRADDEPLGFPAREAARAMFADDPELQKPFEI